MEFATEESGHKAFEELGNEFDWDGTAVKISHERHEDRPRWRRSIYVGNLERNAAEEEMIEALNSHFQQYGEILSTAVPMSK